MEEDLLQVDRLIRLLKEREREREREEGQKEEQDGDQDREIIALATEYLTVGPHVGLYRQRVQAAGYPIYPGEVDGFGWLTAYFQLKQGILLFG